MNLVIFLVISTVFLFMVEIVKRKFLLPTHITRRVSHIGAALIACVSPFYISKDFIVVVCFSFAIVMFFSRKLALFSSIHEVKRKTWGEVFLPLGEAISAIIFLPHATVAFQYGVLVMGFSDSFAGFVGEKYGKHQIKLFNNKKSLEGTLAFFLTTIFLTYLFAPNYGSHLILIPLVLTLVELLLGYGIDNLVISVLGAFLFHYYIR